MTLAELCQHPEFGEVQIRGEAQISSVEQDSRKCMPGSLFVCVPGGSTDSHRYIEGAIQNGAVAVLTTLDRLDGTPAGFPAIGLADFREQIWKLCRRFHRDAVGELRLYGVTGTNGKTTTAWIVCSLLKALGERAGYIGTIGIFDGESWRPADNTTPFTVELYNQLAALSQTGVTAVSLEVSSHALDQRRADGLDFEACGFTNLTQDHLDYHGTMENYAEAKWGLFDRLLRRSERPGRSAAINGDDPVGRVWASKWDRDLISFSREINEAGLWTSGAEIGLDSITASFHLGSESQPVTVGLGGSFNLENVMCAVSMLIPHFGFDRVMSALPSITPVPGRLEPIPNHQGFTVLVDYAHTPDALIKVLETVREVNSTGKVITVFGCGGDRDKTKRPIMATAASSRSDLTVITSDNPRSEDPVQIARDVESGIVLGAESVTILDRKEAIVFAIGQAKPGDVVLIAGKGHENYQIIGTDRLAFDDRWIAREALDAYRPN